MKYCELIAGAILGLFIALSWQFIYTAFFSFKYLRPLKGKYKCYYKNGKEAKEITELLIEKVKGRTLFLKTTNNNGAISESEVYFENPKNAKGWYIELNEKESESENKNKHTFGFREIIVVSKNHINLWNKYSKDKSYEDNADFSTINKSFVCRKVDN